MTDWTKADHQCPSLTSTHDLLPVAGVQPDMQVATAHESPLTVVNISALSTVGHCIRGYNVGTAVPGELLGRHGQARLAGTRRAALPT